MRRRPQPTPGDALLAADPDAARHLRRASLLALPAAVLVVAQAFALARLIVALAQRGEFDPVAAGVLVGAAAVRGLVSWWLERSGRQAAAAAIGCLRTRLVDQAATLSASAPGALRPGEVAADAVHQLPAIEAYLGRFLSGRPAAAATTVVVLAAVASTDLLSAALLAPTVPLLIVFLWLVGTEARAASEARLASLQLLGAHLLDVLRGLTDLRAFGRADHQRGQVDAAAAGYRRETMETLRAAFLSGLVLELVAMLGTALVAVIGGVRLAGGDATLAAILPALVLAPELYAPLRRLGAGYHDAADARAALDRLAAVERLALEAPVAGTRGASPSPTPAGGTIVLDRVTVDAADGRAPRLSDVSLALVAGETIALVGPSGAGKSTLASLLLGLIGPTSGAVLVQGRRGGDGPSTRVVDGSASGSAGAAVERPASGLVDLATVDLAPWHAASAWVAQSPVLLPATLRENTRLSAPHADDAAILAALAEAGLGELVAALPAGLDTRLGDGAALLSSGELRRLALARVVLAGAELVVLDEPTAQLDALTATRLEAAIARLCAGRTTVLITHDPAVAARADRIVTLEGGRIVEIEEGDGTLAAAPTRGVSSTLAAAPTRGVSSALAAAPTGPVSSTSLGGRTSDYHAYSRGNPTFGAPQGPSTNQPALTLRAALALLRPRRRDPIRRLVRRAVGLGAVSALSGVSVLAISGGLIVQASTRPPVLELTSVIVLVRMFSILRATTRYGERLAGHDAALRILQRVRVAVFAHLAGSGSTGAAGVGVSSDGRGSTAVSSTTAGESTGASSTTASESTGVSSTTASESTAQALDRAVGDVDRTADLLVRVLVPAVAAIVTAVVASLVATIFSVWAGLTIAAFAIVGGAVFSTLGSRAGAVAARAEADRGALAAAVVTAVDAGPELLLAGRTAEQRDAIAQRSDALEQGAATNGARSAALSAGIAVWAAAAAVVIAALTAASVGAGDLSGAIAAGLVLAALAATERLDGLADASLASAPATAAVTRLRAALDGPALPVSVGRSTPALDGPAMPVSAAASSVSAASPTTPARRPSPWSRDALQVSAVELRRGGRLILDGASLDLAPGERVALTGESGAGKSSLLLALAGLLPVDAGIGIRSAQADRAPEVLLVPSHPHLFGGSLAANLRLASPDASDADLVSALTAVGLRAWLAALPEGLGTLLGEGGVTASGGQRQRIGLARAVLSPAPIVLLDEPASHLPEADARAALGAVLRARPTRSAIVVSHRATERELATRELRLTAGRLSEVTEPTPTTAPTLQPA